METKGKFKLMSIAEFRDYLNKLDISGLRPVNHVQIHHTWSPSYRNFNGRNHFDKLASMESDHIARGFGQIAQHYTTFPDGTIAVCRPLSVIPTCIHGHNTGGICIENLGNFDNGGDTMTGIHAESILSLNALLLIKFNLAVNTDSLVYHHWFRQSDGFRDNGMGQSNLADHKTCPGTNFFGGNTVAAATAGFLPQVQQCLNNYKNAIPSNPAVPKKGEVNAELLNIRNGPGGNYGVVGQLKKHSAVQVIETHGDWDRIGPDQWVNADFIALT